MNKTGNKPKYKVVVDTNILRGNPLGSELNNFIKNYKSNNDIQLTFFAPEVVIEEYIKFFIIDVERFLSEKNGSNDSLYKFMGIKYSKEKTTRSLIRKQAEKIISDLGINIIQTPYNKIDLKEIVKKAVYYIPPFEAKHEKGFKDSIISETINHDFNKENTDTNYIFICSDKTLFSYISNSKIANKANFKIFQSIPEFESDMRLTKVKIDKKFIKDLSAKAKDIFYNQDGPENSLFNKFNVKEKINQIYGHLFSNPERHHAFGRLLGSISVGGSTPEVWAPIEQIHFEVSKPIFIKHNKGVYEWNSVIVSRQKFESTIKNVGWMSRNNQLLQHVLEFEVTWGFELNLNGEIIKPSLVDIKNTSVNSYDIYPYAEFSEVRSSYPTTISGATLSGIGTVPVGSYDDIIKVNYTNEEGKK